MKLPLLSLLAFGALFAPSHAAAPATLFAQPDKELISDALTAASKPAEWKAAKGKWDRAEDGTHVEQIPADNHGAASRITTKFQDCVVAVEFRLDGANSISLSINSVKEHMARVTISPTALRIQRDDSDHDGPDKAVLFLAQAEKFEPGTWHSIVLEMLGDTMVATIDGKISGFGSNDLFKLEKANPGLTCGGKSATFRNFSIWSVKAEPKADWKATSAKIAEAMKVAPQPPAPAAAAAAKGKVTGKAKAKAAK